MRTRFLLLSPLLAALLCGCAPVQPWQRGVLAKPAMAADPEPLQRTLAEHVRNSREGIAASAANRGAGCGCY